MVQALRDAEARKSYQGIIFLFFSTLWQVTIQTFGTLRHISLLGGAFFFFFSFSFVFLRIGGVGFGCCSFQLFGQ